MRELAGYSEQLPAIDPTLDALLASVEASREDPYGLSVPTFTYSRGAIAGIGTAPAPHTLPYQPEEFARDTRIHPIPNTPGKTMRSVLEYVGLESGGQAVFVTRHYPNCSRWFAAPVAPERVATLALIGKRRFGADFTIGDKPTDDDTHWPITFKATYGFEPTFDGAIPDAYFDPPSARREGKAGRDRRPSRMLVAGIVEDFYSFDEMNILFRLPSGWTKTPAFAKIRYGTLAADIVYVAVYDDSVGGAVTPGHEYEFLPGDVVHVPTSVSADTILAITDRESETPAKLLLQPPMFTGPADERKANVIVAGEERLSRYQTTRGIITDYLDHLRQTTDPRAQAAVLSRLANATYYTLPQHAGSDSTWGRVCLEDADLAAINEVLMTMDEADKPICSFLFEEKARDGFACGRVAAQMRELLKYPQAPRGLIHMQKREIVSHTLQLLADPRTEDQGVADFFTFALERGHPEGKKDLVRTILDNLSQLGAYSIATRSDILKSVFDSTDHPDFASDCLLAVQSTLRLGSILNGEHMQNLMFSAIDGLKGTHGGQKEAPELSAWLHVAKELHGIASLNFNQQGMLTHTIAELDGYIKVIENQLNSA